MIKRLERNSSRWLGSSSLAEQTLILPLDLRALWALAVRGLAQRGKLLTDDPVLSFLARRADNGVAWKILEYWRATN